MKILERGCLKTDYYQVKCNRCDSLLEFVTQDIQSCQRDGDYIICPVCGAYIDVSSAKFMGERPIDKEDYK